MLSVYLWHILLSADVQGTQGEILRMNASGLSVQTTTIVNSLRPVLIPNASTRALLRTFADRMLSAFRIITKECAHVILE